MISNLHTVVSYQPVEKRSFSMWHRFVTGAKPATGDIAPVTNRCHTFSTACYVHKLLKIDSISSSVPLYQGWIEEG